MLKLLRLIALFVLGLTFSANATHIQGGEIYYDHVQGGTYDIYVKLYRDVTGAGMPSSLNLVVTGHSFLTSLTATQLSTSPTHKLVCGNNGIDVYLYKVTANLGALSSSGISISYSNCCRPAGILNIANSMGAEHKVSTTMMPDPGQTYSSSSARFYNSFTTATNVDSLNQVFGSVAYDPDSEDSIHVEFASPQSSNGAIPFSTGYSKHNPLGVGQANTFLDSLSGLISTSNVGVGSYVIALKVKSYKNGALNSIIRRDLTFFVSSGSTASPSQDIQNITTTGFYSTTANTVHVDLNLGDSFSCLIKGTSTNNDTVAMVSDGIFLNTGTTGHAVLTASNGSWVNTDSTKAQFSFTPTTSIFPIGVNEMVLNFEISSGVKGSCGEWRLATNAIVVRVVKSSSIWNQSQYNVCKGGAVQAQILGDTTNLHWSPSTGVSDTTSASPLLSPSSSTLYTVTNLNDGSTSQLYVGVDTLAKPILGSNGTLAFVTNKPDSASIVWYYSGVAIALNVDTIQTPVSGVYFAIVDYKSCTQFSDTVTVVGGNFVPIANGNNGNAIVVNGNGVYQFSFNVGQYGNTLNQVYLALIDSGFFKTGSIPEINVYDNQQQLIKTSVLVDAGDGMWKAENLGVNLPANETFTMEVLTHNGLVALFKPSALPYTEDNGVVTVESAIYSDNGTAMNDAFPYMVFGFSSAISIEEHGLPVSIYPNPIQDWLFVEAQSNGQMTIMDVAGRIVRSTEINGTTKIYTGDLQSGIYIYHLDTDRTKKSGKLIK